MTIEWTYRDLLKKMADYGHGIFTITMLENAKERLSLKLYIYRNPKLFNVQKGTHGDIKFCSLTSDGMNLFSGQDSMSNAKSWASFADMALINAYMIEQNDLVNYLNKPHVKVRIAKKIVGIISPKWGLTKEIRTVSVLLSLPNQRRELLENVSLLKRIADKECLPIETLSTKISAAITPKAFANLR